MRTITVELGERSYPISIGQGLLDRVAEVHPPLTKFATVGVVTDSNVGPMYAKRVIAQLEAAGCAVTVHTMTAGEDQKRLARIEEITGTFLDAGLDRSSAVVALGGGVVGDVAGFAAASYMRGLPFVQIPTTIVAQVDSSVGGKTGVNHPAGKNTIGAFHQPDAVIIDTTCLTTLPERELRAGLAEVIKHGVIADAELFAYMEDNAAKILGSDLDVLEYPIVRSCEIKAGVVAEDERESGLRAILNYGHTFGHGIEAATQYTRFLHGEAIALGMCAAGAAALEVGLVDADFVARQRACIEAYGLPVTCGDLPVDATLDAMKHDKKARAGTLKFILADRMGHVVQRTDITEDTARRALESLRG